MTRQWRKVVATAAAAALIAILAGEAVAASAVHPLGVHHRRHVAGDIYVRKGRPLDPAPGAAVVGSENHYVVDSMPTSITTLGAPFSAHAGGFDLLPDRFNPPGVQEPLIQF